MIPIGNIQNRHLVFVGFFELWMYFQYIMLHSCYLKYEGGCKLWLIWPSAVLVFGRDLMPTNARFTFLYKKIWLHHWILRTKLCSFSIFHMFFFVKYCESSIKKYIVLLFFFLLWDFVCSIFITLHIWYYYNITRVEWYTIINIFSKCLNITRNQTVPVVKLTLLLYIKKSFSLNFSTAERKCSGTHCCVFERGVY